MSESAFGVDHGEVFSKGKHEGPVKVLQGMAGHKGQIGTAAGKHARKGKGKLIALGGGGAAAAGGGAYAYNKKKG